MRPLLLLQSRPEHHVADHEYAAFLQHGHLPADQLQRVAIHERQPAINLDDYAGIIMGGGPANFSTPDHLKSTTQRQYEPWLFRLLADIIATDKPFLGTCLGLGALVTHLGGTMTLAAGEIAGPVAIHVTPAASSDPLLQDLPSTFHAIVGHKEGALVAPANTTVLASSEACIQMIRIGRHVYGTQFHPELTADGLGYRLEAYKHSGYCDPDEIANLVAQAHTHNVTQPVRILENFISLCRDTN